MGNRKKLIWKQVDKTFHLQLVNTQDVNQKVLRDMLEKVKRPNPKYNKPFNQEAYNDFKQWLENIYEPLPEAFYCLLSNWFLTHCSASKSSRAGYAKQLWEALFCATPKDRLTDWRISGRKVVPDRFKQWWKEQNKCQEDC